MQGNVALNYAIFSSLRFIGFVFLLCASFASKLSAASDPAMLPPPGSWNGGGGSGGSGSGSGSSPYDPPTLPPERASLPNLTSTALLGWADRIVVEKQPGKYDEAFRDLYPTDDLYVSFAVVNDSSFSQGTASPFTCTLAVDGRVKVNGSFGTMAPGEAYYINSFNIGKLKQGWHQFTVRIDSRNNVKESDETDNVYSHWVFISQAPVQFVAPTPAKLVSPTVGETLTSSNVIFTWDAGLFVTKYRLRVGTAPGFANLYSGPAGTALSAYVTGLPTNGAPIYVSVQSLIHGKWKRRDYVFRVGDSVTRQQAVIKPPTFNTVGNSRTTTFTWDGGTGAKQYRLSIGTSFGGKNLYDANQGRRTSRTISNLPGGMILYVRIRTQIGGNWFTYDASYFSPATGNTAESAIGMEQPLIGAAKLEYGGLLEPVLFFDPANELVNGYWLTIGSSPGASDIYQTGRFLTPHVKLPDYVLGADNPQTVYIRLIRSSNGQLSWSDYTMITRYSVPISSTL